MPKKEDISGCSEYRLCHFAAKNDKLKFWGTRKNPNFQHQEAFDAVTNC